MMIVHGELLIHTYDKSPRDTLYLKTIILYDTAIAQGIAKPHLSLTPPLPLPAVPRQSWRESMTIVESSSIVLHKTREVGVVDMLVLRGASSFQGLALGMVMSRCGRRLGQMENGLRWTR